MRIAIIGSRGIPASYGGFETFAEEISTRLANENFNVTVVCQQGKPIESNFGNINLKYSNFSKDKNPVRFYHDSLKIALSESELVLVCGVGGAIFYPLLKNSKTRIITHVDGREELRGKYSWFKKIYVRLSQVFAAKYSDHIVADSHAIKIHWQKKYGLAEQKVSAIAYGALLNYPTDESILDELSLYKNSYYLVVCRMVPENNLEMIVRGFNLSGTKRKLILVGNLSPDFGERLKKYSSEQIKFVGGIYDKEKLFALRKYCIAYLHGHSVGGTNPSLLESMAAGNICICHDNEYNRETTNNEMLYFGNDEDLSEKIKEGERLSEESKSRFTSKAVARLSSIYNWEVITLQYVNLFNSLHHDRRI